MTKLWDQKAVLAVNEATYGTDQVPTGAANAILTTNGNWTPLAGEQRSRELDRTYQGAQEAVVVNQHGVLSFDVEIAGAGAAGDVPGYDPLLRAAGFAQTVNAGVDVQYDPVSAAFDSMSLYFNQSGIRQRFLGARSAVSMALTPSEYPKFTFRVLGLFTAPTDTALPTADVSGFETPLPVSDANTPTFTIGGTDRVMESLNFDMAHDLRLRALVNQEQVVIPTRNPNGTVVIEAPDLATFDPVAAARAGTKYAMQLVHGTAAGNIVQLDWTSIQMDAPTPGNTDNIMNWSIPFRALPVAGDDEFKITVK